jgi:hypothetical protein
VHTITEHPCCLLCCVSVFPKFMFSVYTITSMYSIVIMAD